MSMTEEADTPRELVEAVRDACVRAVQNGYEAAAQSGLCPEGALEAAIDALRQLDVDAVIAELKARSPSKAP